MPIYRFTATRRRGCCTLEQMGDDQDGERPRDPEDDRSASHRAEPFGPLYRFGPLRSPGSGAARSTPDEAHQRRAVLLAALLMVSAVAATVLALFLLHRPG